MTAIVLILLLAGFAVVAAFSFGFRRGVAAERTRVTHVFNVAFFEVSSGALNIVYDAILNDTSVQDLRLNLVQHATRKADRQSSQYGRRA